MTKRPRGRPPLPDEFKAGKLMKPIIRVPHQMAIALRMFYGEYEIRKKFLQWTRDGVNFQGDLHPQLKLALVKWLDEAIALEEYKDSQDKE